LPDQHGAYSRSILIAEDDEDDRDFVLSALRETSQTPDVRFVRDGAELLAYLRRDGPYAVGDAIAPRPAVILLDLNMPKMDGREALAEIKQDQHLRPIPVIVLTTSNDNDDIVRSYDLGASSFITKPVTFQGLVDVLRDWSRYWFEIVELPVSSTA
jgi:CheY-like chemotaxis protein